MINVNDIRAAAAANTGRVHRTPLLSSRTLGQRADATVFIKAECFQRTGSFKIRGVLNRLRQLTPEQKQRGVIGWSAGNHAAALAYGASLEGIRCMVVMPETAVKSKVDASRGYGAEIVQHAAGMLTFQRMQELRDEHGLTLVHPFDDPEVIAGQGTIGLELLEDAPDLDAVIVPVGGGGLISGIATAVKALRPETAVYGVEPDGAAGLTAALREGKVVQLERTQTIADGLAAPFTGENSLQHSRAYVDNVVLVSDDEISAALRVVLERCKILVEPAGAASVAALLSGRIPVAGKRVAVLASGGNIDLSRLRDLLT